MNKGGIPRTIFKSARLARLEGKKCARKIEFHIPEFFFLTHGNIIPTENYLKYDLLAGCQKNAVCLAAKMN